MNIVYRPEIDGLRTVSVMLVIFHHLGWSFFPGGYIGVDVFFVISGFLITSIVTTEIQAGKFSIGNFYKRRVIRLAPTYFLVLATTSIASMLIMLPPELINHFTSVIYSTFFSANFYMWQEVGGYFGSQSNVVPLLHLWSLAVEEQFYIFWPLALLIGLRLIPTRFTFAVLTLVFVALLFVSEWGVQNYRAAAYYLMPTRAFELLLGSLLVYLPPIKWGVLTRNVIGLTGLTLIFYSATTYSTETLFPGLNALVPCLGAALILSFCKGALDLSGRLLATTPMVFIGRISYPAYLWHWPIIAFLNIYMIQIVLPVGIAVIATTLCLSYLTYLYVEQPANALRKSSAKKIIGYGFAVPALSFFCISSLTKFNDGWPTRFPESLNLKSAALQSQTSKTRGRCNEGSVINPLTEDQCILGLTNRPADFLLIGDSHANHFTSMIDVMAKDAGLRGHDITQSNTIFLPGAKSYYTIGGEKIEYKNFSARNETIKKIIEQKKYKAVILGGSFASHYNTGDFEAGNAKSSQEAFENQFNLAVDIIKNSGSSVFIIKGAPTLDGIEHDCSLNNERFSLKHDCSINLEAHHQKFKSWSLFLERLNKNHPDIIVIDPTKATCNDRLCFSEIEGVPLYRDREHLNHMGSELIGKIYISQFGNPLSVINSSKNQLTVHEK